MKKLGIICMALMLVGGFAFTQAQELGFSNTLYTGFGTANIRNDGVSNGNTDFKFEGLVDHFTANITTRFINVSGDITWEAFEYFNFKARILDYNFNGYMTPFNGFNIGFGTNLNWQIGPRPFSGPQYTAYETPYFAGIGIFSNSAGMVQNSFAQDSIALRYTYENHFSVGFGLNGGLSGNIGGGIGLWGNIMDVLTLGFAYNGSFGETGNNFYFGSQILLNPLDIDIWLNIDQGSNVTFGSRFEFYSPTKTFFFAPEFSISVWEQKYKGLSMYLSFLGEMSITRDTLLGLNVSWGLGSDQNTESDIFDGGNRLNITPHLVWNISKNHRLSVGANFMPVWWQSDATDFFWNIPISWTVKF